MQRSRPSVGLRRWLLVLVLVLVGCRKEQVETERGSVRHKNWTLRPSSRSRAAQTAPSGPGVRLLGCPFPLRPDPSRPVHCTQTGLHSLTHAHLPSFSFLSLCPNPVADEGLRRPCTAVSHCRRPRGRTSQCLSRGCSTTSNPKSQHASSDNKEALAYRRSEARARSGLLIPQRA